jgi:hypothetical protein
VKTRRTFTIPVTALKIAMLQRGLSSADLAKLVGKAEPTIRNQVSRGVPSTQLRAEIEAALGLALWDTPENLILRLQCRNRFGFDPAQKSFLWLKAETRRARLAPSPEPRHIAGWIQAWLNFIAATPGQNRTQTTKQKQS